MFGGEDMDLNNLQFASGSARLDEKTIKALNIVAKAMQDRPGIKIQIIGMASEKEDGEGLKEQLLMRDMRYAIYRDTTSATNAKVLTAAQIDKAIKQLYSESTAPNSSGNAILSMLFTVFLVFTLAKCFLSRPCRALLKPCGLLSTHASFGLPHALLSMQTYNFFFKIRVLTLKNYIFFRAFLPLCAVCVYACCRKVYGLLS